MISVFWNHVAMVVFFGICAVIWVRSLIYIWRIPDENKIWDYMGYGYTPILIGPPLAAYFIIKDAW